LDCDGAARRVNAERRARWATVVHCARAAPAKIVPNVRSGSLVGITDHDTPARRAPSTSRPPRSRGHRGHRELRAHEDRATWSQASNGRQQGVEANNVDNSSWGSQRIDKPDVSKRLLAAIPL